MIVPIVAVLNGPVANAFAAVKETGAHVMVKTIRQIPVPFFTTQQAEEIGTLVAEYRKAIGAAHPLAVQQAYGEADRLLRQIDAIVLEAYGLPPRLERVLLDYFNGFNNRPIPFRFADYFPHDFKPFFSLRDWLTGTTLRQR